MIYRAIADHRDYLKTWLPFIANLSEQDEMDFLSQVLSFPEEERNFTFVIECRGEFCGLVGFVNSDFVNHRTEIGYWLLPEYQRQGIMTRSVRDTLSMGCGSTFDASHSNSVCRKKLFE